MLLFGILAAFFVAGLFALDLLPTHRALVLTVPGGAMVSVGGAPPMPSPFSVPVHRGGTRLAVTHQGFRGVDTTVTPGADTILVYLQRLCGFIVITEPPGLAVECDGFTGWSPCTIPLPGPGTYQVTIRSGNGIMDRFSHILLDPELVAFHRRLPVPVPGEPALVKLPGSLLSGGSDLTVGVHEVTVAQFTEFMNSVDPDLRRTGSEIPGRTILSDSILKCNWPLPVRVNEDSARYEPVPGMERHAMSGMTQQGAEWFCRWLSESDGRGFKYRLPEPGEWTDLSGAGGTWVPVPGQFNCSDASEGILARHPEIDDGFPAVAPVGSYPGNPWGLYDTAGNVWEWTASPGMAAGGSWLSSLDDCAPGTLAPFTPGIGYPFVGFRVVADMPQNDGGGS